MKINSSHRLLKEVQSVFSQAYPFLKIEFAKKTSPASAAPADSTPGASPVEEDNDHAAARELLWDEFALTGDMTITELEVLLQYHFGMPLQILRKSGNLWMETRMTRHWTLRQQNEHGADLASG